MRLGSQIEQQYTKIRRTNDLYDTMKFSFDKLCF